MNRYSLRPLALLITAIMLCCAPSLAEDPSTAPYEAKLVEAEKESVKWTKSSVPGYLSLQQCVELALKGNFRISEAREQIEKRLGIELQAKAVMRPKLRAQGQYRRIDEDRLTDFDGTTFGSDEGWDGIVEIEQPLFLGGEGLAARREEAYRVEAARQALQAVVNNVLLDVKTRFYDVLLAHDRIKVRREAVNLLEEEFGSEQNRLAAGTVSQFNVLRSEVELANARTPLIQARNEFRIALEELNRVVALSHEDAASVTPSIKIQGTLEFQEPFLDLPAALAQARVDRPEIQSLKLLVDAEKQGIKLARSDFFPELLVFAGYAGESSRFNDDLSDVDHGWEAGLRLRWDIFDGGRSFGKVKEARASKNQAQIALRQQLLNVDIEVRRAMSRLVEARELVIASRKVVEQAKESLRLARARLEAGSGRQLDVLDTRVSLTEAQTNVIESLYSFNLALATLDRAIGKKSVPVTTFPVS